MILDNALLFTGTSNGATSGVTSTANTDSVAQTVNTYSCSNIIDIGLNGLPTAASGGGARDLAVGDKPALKMMIRAVSAFTTATTGTVQFILSGAPDNGSGAAGSYTTMWTSAAFTAAQGYAGADLATIDLPRPIPGQALPRFLRLQFVVASATMTGGTVEATIVVDRDDQIMGTSGNMSGYPAGITIAN